MDFLKNIEWTPMNILKAAGILLVALILLSIAFNLFLKPAANSVGSVMKDTRDFAASTQGSAPAAYGGGYDSVDEDYAYYAEQSRYGYGGEEPMLSLNNIGIPTPTPRPAGSVGGDAEEFEVTEYSVSIETRDRDDTCKSVSKLKEFDYVVFESANEHDRGCNYTFKVEHAHVEEVLATLKAFDPKDISESTYTIQRQLEDFTSEADILENKLASIDETLKNAIQAYDDITAIATRTQNVESLAKIIDSRLNLIERLTQERINITARLERLERSRAEQLDRLEYTYFYVNIYENKFIDGESLMESWKAAVQKFVRDVNRTVQDITINLVALLFLAAQYILYFFILLIVAKYLWKVTKHIWNR